MIAPVTVNLGGAGAGAFYSDAGCTIPVVTATIAALTSSTSFYYQNNTVQTVTLTVNDAAAVLTGDSLIVTVDGPTQLAVLGSD